MSCDLKKRQTSYTAYFKLKVVNFVEENSNQAAEHKFLVSEKLVRDRRKAKINLQEMPNGKRAHCRKAAQYPDVEKELLDWLCSRRNNGYVANSAGH